MPPRGGRQGLSRSRDDYAAQRCLCGHLVYVPGEPCLAAVAYDPPRCPCRDHRIPEAPGGDAA
jgi:hypothetical protein